MVLLKPSTFFQLGWLHNSKYLQVEFTVDQGALMQYTQKACRHFVVMWYHAADETVLSVFH